MNRTKIPWADYTWNPITGCSPASEGCEHCYAETLSKRRGWPWGNAVFHEDRLCRPLRVKTPSRVFVCSMSDLWHETVRDSWRIAVFDAMHHAPQHTYQLLTKRPQRIHPEWAPPDNWWIGCTCENQARADERWAYMAKIACPIRFVSVEPMLSPVSFAKWGEYERPDWVIAGPETGPGARPCEERWLEALDHESVCYFDKRDCWLRREWPAGKEGGK